ncbi:MAG: restriction endonuclease [Cyanobacteria bacterium J06648_1]
MPIPDFQTLMLPLLKLAEDKQEHLFKEAIPFLANQFQLTEIEKRELLPSGKQARFNNRVYWTKTHLEKAGLLSSPRRGAFKITTEGANLLNCNPTFINTKFLEQYKSYSEFRNSRNSSSLNDKSVVTEDIEQETPEEALEKVHQQLIETLSTDILRTIKKCSPYFFEFLVVDLLVSMGYGGSRKEAGQAVGKSGDEGIDGIIKEDRLGLDVIYIQAKRWDNIVNRPEIQKFAGALLGQSAKKGIFITTSDFSKGAIDYVTRIDSKIILVNGTRLAELIIEHNVGVTSVAKYEVKKIDFDYFIED